MTSQKFEPFPFRVIRCEGTGEPHEVTSATPFQWTQGISSDLDEFRPLGPILGRSHFNRLWNGGGNMDLRVKHSQQDQADSQPVPSKPAGAPSEQSTE